MKTPPFRMAEMPTDPDRPHFHVPWFVAWIDGKPDYRVIDAGKIPEAVRKQKCWLCGQRLGSTFAFVIGPMCSITRTISEPPMHVDCAEYAVSVCPFLTSPRMRRNEKDLPENIQAAAGLGLKRNPGCVLIWKTKSFKPFRAFAGENGVLFNIGEPCGLSYWAEGRAATRDEIMASIESGLPSLHELAEAQSPAAVKELEKRVIETYRLVETHCSPQNSA